MNWKKIVILILIVFCQKAIAQTLLVDTLLGIGNMQSDKIYTILLVPPQQPRWDTCNCNIQLKLFIPQDSVKVLATEGYFYYKLNTHKVDSLMRRNKNITIKMPRYEVQESRYEVYPNCLAIADSSLFTTKNLNDKKTHNVGIAVYEHGIKYTAKIEYKLIDSAQMIRREKGFKTVENIDETSDLLQKTIVLPTYQMVYDTANFRNIRYQIWADNLNCKSILSGWREYVSYCHHLDKPIVLEIQQALQAKGYRVKLTNMMDKKTKEALIKFQKNHNLPEGNLDAETLKLLGIHH
ncbi:MAG: putative peptidoglycan binding domain [Bacteroidota bacterium]|jgi:hypothetical protein